MITWIVEDDSRFHDNRNASRLMFAAQELGHKVLPIPLEPQGSRNWEELLGEVQYPSLLFISINTLLELKELKNPNLCIWYDKQEFSCSSYLSKYGSLCLNFPAVYLSKYFLFQESFVQRLYDFWARDDMIFFRPDDNEKGFPGDTVLRNQVPAWLEYDLGHLSADYRILAAPPQKIEAEYRVVMVGGKAVSGGRYRYKGHLDLEKLAIDSTHPACQYAEHTASIHRMSPLYVCDVAELDDGSYKIVEVGDFAVAGLYNNDVREIVREVDQFFKGKN